MQEGTSIGSYRVIRQIGAGGMGEVWLAEHITLGRKAAIKVLRPELSRRDDIVARFFNEARAATAISDPGIVQIFDVGQHVDGSAYIVMELLDGEPLDQRLRRIGTLPLVDTLRIVRQVATSLGAAHARNIVHRDLKPENIFIVRDAEVTHGERAKLLDFGIAKLIGADTGVKTQTAAVLGTPAYMSPEQCRGAGLVDARSDVYSLGCVLFALITGRPPFEGEGIGDLIVMHMQAPPPRASMLVPGIPVELDDVIARCLAKDPETRYRTGTELALALSAIGAGTVELPPLSSRTAAMPTTLSSLAVEVPERRASRTWMVGATLAVVVIVSVLALRARNSEIAAVDAAATIDSAVIAAPPTPPPAPTRDLERLTSAQLELVLASIANCPVTADLVERADAWGNPLVVTCLEREGRKVIRVSSAGPDHRADTEDDLHEEKTVDGPTPRATKTATPPSTRPKPSAAGTTPKPATPPEPEPPIPGIPKDRNL